MSMQQFNEWLHSKNSKDVSLLATMCELVATPISKLASPGPEPAPENVWNGWH